MLLLMMKISSSLSEANFAQRLACVSFAQWKTSETNSEAIVSFAIPRCFCAPLSLNEIPSFAQRELPSLSEAPIFCIISKPNNVNLNLFAQNLFLNCAGAVPQTLIDQFSKKRTKPTQKHTKTVKTTTMHKNITNQNTNEKTYKVGDLTIKHNKNNGKGPRNRR